MIDLEIIKSIDSDSVGRYKINKSKIELGTSLKSTLRIYDNKFKTPLLISIKHDGSANITNSDPDGFLANNKKYLYSKPIKPGEEIKFGETIIVIHEIKSDTEKKESMSAKKRALIKALKASNPKVIPLLDAIEEDLVKLGPL